jgi:hypothetical protein
MAVFAKEIALLGVSTVIVLTISTGTIVVVWFCNSVVLIAEV